MSHATTNFEQELAERRQRYRHLAAVLREWMEDESGYDERVAPVLAEELAREPVRLRQPNAGLDDESRA